MRSRTPAVFSWRAVVYRYMVIEGLRGGRDDSAYVSFHRCVYVAARWLEVERQEGRVVDQTQAINKLAAEWDKSGPKDHPFEKFYFQAARGMVTAMVALVQGETGRYDRADWDVEVGGRTITVTPDRVVVEADGGVRVQRIRTGRETKSEPDKPIYALLRKGAEIRYQGKSVSAEILYLASGNVVRVPPRNDEKLLKVYRDAIGAIENGEFPPEPDARMCPNCPCYFQCRG